MVLYYNCGAEDGTDIKRTGKIKTQEMPTGPQRRYILFTFVPKPEFTTIFSLPDAWVRNQHNRPNWRIEESSIGILLIGSKESLDISSVDFFICRENNNNFKIDFVDGNYYYHYTTVENLAKIRNSKVIKQCRYHGKFSRINEKGVCLTDAHPNADSHYILRTCFRGGVDSNRQRLSAKVSAYIKMPKQAVEAYAQRSGFTVEQYPDGRRSFILTTGGAPLPMDQIGGWSAHPRHR